VTASPEPAGTTAQGGTADAMDLVPPDPPATLDATDVSVQPESPKTTPPTGSARETGTSLGADEDLPSEPAPGLWEDAPHIASRRTRAPASTGSKTPARPASRSKSSSREPAADRPVARVCVDVGLAHLDRPFDYLVPSADADTAQPGVRVRVRFAGQLLDGLILERVAASEHGGTLVYLEKVVSPERVLRPEIAVLARAVADRYAGTLADVVRLAVPPRHGRTEAAGTAVSVPARDGQTETAGTPVSVPPRDGRTETVGTPVAVPPADGPELDVLVRGWQAYTSGASFVQALGEGRTARAVWTALPGEAWPDRIAEAVAAARRSGRGALVVVADGRDLDRLDAALTGLLGAGRHVALSAAVGPAERYRRFLAASRGQVDVVIGNRAAMFAPVARLGLAVIWDDGDDLHSEPRAPYPHAREVLLTRAQQADASVLIGGYGRTVEAAQLLDNGWARELAGSREAVRASAPLVTAVGDDIHEPEAGAARLPTVAWRAARDALAHGDPVLVQVPRRGYLPSVACGACRTPARCAYCHGPLSLTSAGGQAVCRWCARVAAGWACPVCGGRAIRASVVGARRTAEELGRVFTDVPVWTSGRDGVLATVDPRPALVIATPGAEPVVAGGGYGAVLLLDTWALLTRADLRAGEETLRRWLAAAALALPARRGGRVVVVADGGLAAVQALVRFDPGWLAARDLAERRELGFPPAVRMASLTGTPAAVAELLATAGLPASADVLGPVPVGEDQERYLVRVPRAAGRALAEALRAALGVRSARKVPDSVRVQIDPLELI
jgi:primosomal protein N' (replication factor Y) (superfamily II helicase)